MRVRTGFAVGLTVCVAAVVVAGCGGSSESEETTLSGPPTPTSQSLPYAGAPAVAQPLDTKSIDNDPCAVATDAQIVAIAGFALKSRSVDGQPKAQYCYWSLVDGHGSLSGGTLVVDDQGLSSAYEQHAAGKMRQFEVVAPIDGYPAVAATRVPREGYCPLRVGLRDDLTYLASASLDYRHPAFKDPCSVARKVAELAIRHLKGA